MTERMKYWMWLGSIPYMPPVKLLRLLGIYRCPENIWKAGEAELRALPFLTHFNIRQLMASKDCGMIEKNAYNIYKSGISMLTVEDGGYPEMLKSIYDPPLVLYYKGNFKPDEKMVAIVGSRRATSYGQDAAEKTAYELAQNGITIISGMARGIDSCGHRGALRAKGRTVAVLGSGLDIVYPSENRELYERIIENGSVWSEYLPGTRPLKVNFPARNRIISGAALGVAVIEAGDGSGSLITADFALEQGREVFALPGNVRSLNSKGTNRLIRDGAGIITETADILDALGIPVRYGPAGRNGSTGRSRQVKNAEFFHALELTPDEQTIAGAMDFEWMHVDRLADITGLEVQAVCSGMVSLELKGIVEQRPGKIFRLMR